MGSYSLKISCWNIQGLRSSIFDVKSQHSDFKREIQNSDIIILQETWNVRDLSTGCPIGFREIILPSTKLRGVTQGRDSGGMLIWYRTELIDSIKSKKIGKSYIWLKIQKDIVSTDRHILLCATYLPPAESPYYNEETFPDSKLTSNQRRIDVSRGVETTLISDVDPASFCSSG